MSTLSPFFCLRSVTFSEWKHYRADRPQTEEGCEFSATGTPPLSHSSAWGSPPRPRGSERTGGLLFFSIYLGTRASRSIKRALGIDTCAHHPSNYILFIFRAKKELFNSEQVASGAGQYAGCVRTRVIHLSEHTWTERHIDAASDRNNCWCHVFWDGETVRVGPVNIRTLLKPCNLNHRADMSVISEERPEEKTEDCVHTRMPPVWV